MNKNLIVSLVAVAFPLALLLGSSYATNKLKEWYPIDSVDKLYESQVPKEIQGDLAFLTQDNSKLKWGEIKKKKIEFRRHLFDVTLTVKTTLKKNRPVWFVITTGPMIVVEKLPQGRDRYRASLGSFGDPIVGVYDFVIDK